MFNVKSQNSQIKTETQNFLQDYDKLSFDHAFWIILTFPCDDEVPLSAMCSSALEVQTCVSIAWKSFDMLRNLCEMYTLERKKARDIYCFTWKHAIPVSVDGCSLLPFDKRLYTIPCYDVPCSLKGK